MSEDLTGRGREIGGIELPFYTEEGKLFNIVYNVPQALKPFNLLCQVYSETPLYIKASSRCYSLSLMDLRMCIFQGVT